MVSRQVVDVVSRQVVDVEEHPLEGEHMFGSKTHHRGNPGEGSSCFQVLRDIV